MNIASESGNRASVSAPTLDVISSVRSLKHRVPPRRACTAATLSASAAARASSARRASSSAAASWHSQSRQTLLTHSPFSTSIHAQCSKPARSPKSQCAAPQGYIKEDGHGTNTRCAPRPSAPSWASCSRLGFTRCTLSSANGCRRGGRPTDKNVDTNTIISEKGMLVVKRGTGPIRHSRDVAMDVDCRHK